MIYDVLKKLNINYEEISHQAVYTVKEAQSIKEKIEGIGCKNLFLTDKKNYYLYLIEENKKADLKELNNIIRSGHLSFASPDALKEILDLEPGSVTPLGLINDKENKVTLLIDKDLQANKILCHPNTNTKTISVLYSDLIKFVQYINHNYKII